jgi:ankyrin repeat protein
MTWTPLHDACVHDDLQQVLQLLTSTSTDNNNSDPLLAVDAHGMTPLHVLMLHPSVQASIVQAMVHACPPQVLTETDYHGNTPLHLACTNRHVDKHMAHVLLDAAPTTISMTNREGLMPLHMACRHVPDHTALIGYVMEAYPYALRSPIKVCRYVYARIF